MCRKRNLVRVTSQAKIIFKELVLAQTSTAKNRSVLTLDVGVVGRHTARELIVLVTLCQRRKRLPGIYKTASHNNENKTTRISKNRTEGQNNHW